MTPFLKGIPLLFLLVLVPLAGQTDFTEYFPCEEGSLDEYALVSRLEEILTDEAIPYRIISYRDRGGRHSFSRSLEISLNPQVEERLYLAVPLNGSDTLAPVNIALATEQLLRLNRSGTDKGVTFLYLGGERNAEPVGTMNYLDHSPPEEGSALIYLDLKGRLPYLVTSSHGVNAPYPLVRDISLIMEDVSLRYGRDDMNNILSRTGIPMGRNALSPWLEKEIPALLITGKNQGEGIDPKEISRVLDRFIAQWSSTGEGEWEKNYMLFSLGNGHIQMGELPSLYLILALVGLFLLIVVIQSRQFKLNLKRNRLKLWVLPLTFSLVFIFLYLSTLILEEIVYLKNLPDLWLRLPDRILFFKLLSALLFSSFFLLIIRGLPLPRTPHFYSYAAVLFTLAGTIILIRRDLILIYYSLWIFLCLFYYLLRKRILAKTVMTMVMPIPLILILTIIVSPSYPELSRMILLDRIEGNLLLTTFIMPPILLLTSLHYNRYYYHRIRRSFTALGIFILIPMALLYILVQILLFDPYGGQERQLVTVEDRIEYHRGERRVAIGSSFPLGRLDFSYNGNRLTLDNLGDSLSIKERMDASFLSYQGTTETFLDRKRLELSIEMIGRPESIDILLYGNGEEEKIIVYDCNFPVYVDADNREVRIDIGKNPVFPLELDLTLTASSKPMLRMTVTYDNPPLEPPRIENKPTEIDYTMVLVDELDLSAPGDSFAFSSSR